MPQAKRKCLVEDQTSQITAVSRGDEVIYYTAKTCRREKKSWTTEGRISSSAPLKITLVR